MLRSILTATALVLTATVVISQADPIGTRRNMMKGVGAATRTGSQMAKGEIPFDLGKAQDILKTYAAAAETFHTHFPETSKTGGETTAAPTVWSDSADFKKRFQDWGVEIKKAADETKDLPTFRTSFGNVTKSCTACHNTYRIKV